MYVINYMSVTYSDSILFHTVLYKVDHVAHSSRAINCSCMLLPPYHEIRTTLFQSPRAGLPPATPAARDDGPLSVRGRQTTWPRAAPLWLQGDAKVLRQNRCCICFCLFLINSFKGRNTRVQQNFLLKGMACHVVKMRIHSVKNSITSS